MSAEADGSVQHDMEIPKRQSSAGVTDGDDMCQILLNDILRYEMLAEAEEASPIENVACEIHEIAGEIANEIGLKELQSDDTSSGQQIPTSRFKTITVDDTDKFLQNSANKNTVYKTKSDLKIFRERAVSIGEFRDIHDISPADLDSLLARFYLSVRRKDGSEYEPDSISSIQNSVDRHLRDMKSRISIKKDVEFRHSRRVLEAKRKELKGQGKRNKKNKADILNTDEMKMLYENGILGSANSRSLRYTVWVNTGVFFGFRGRQEHAYLRWGDTELKTDSKGAEYLEFTERNTKTRTRAKHGDYRKVAPRMFAEPDNPNCPVGMYKQYSSHRPSNMCDPDSRFYLRPLESPVGSIWYSRQPLGKNTIGKMMQAIAGEGNLQGRKVTHTTRKTFATTLLQAGIPPTEVAQLGGWKNLQSLNEYLVPSMEQQEDRSNKLSSVMVPHTENKKNVQIDFPESNAMSLVARAEEDRDYTLPPTSNMMSLATKKDSNPFFVLCGATITGGTINLNIYSGKRRHFHMSESASSQG